LTMLGAPSPQWLVAPGPNIVQGHPRGVRRGVGASHAVENDMSDSTVYLDP
jgi:hypothetical protein